MGILIEIFIEGFIINILGLYTRFFFFKLLGKNVTIKQLSGNTKKMQDNISQNMANAIIGIIMFVPLSLGVLYVIFSVF